MFISPSLTQSCCGRWRYRRINQHPVQQTRRSHRQRSHGADEHGHAGAPAPGHPEPWRRARPAQPAAVSQHHRAEQSCPHRCCNRVWCRGPHRGECLRHFPSLFWSEPTLHPFETFSSVSLHPSLEVQDVGKQTDLMQPRKWVTEHSRKWSVVYKNIELLCSMPETNIINQLYVMHVVCKPIILQILKKE